MKFSGEMCFEIILKVTKNQGFTLSLENTFFEKLQWKGSGGVNPGILGLRPVFPPNDQLISMRIRAHHEKFIFADLDAQFMNGVNIIYFIILLSLYL